MKFTYKEFYNRSIKSGCKPADFTPDINNNICALIERLNKLGYEPSMYFSSCLRSKDKHKQIYINKGVAEDKIPWGSSHLSGCACDVADPDGKLGDWLMTNDKKVVEANLWVEHPDYTPGWVHFDIMPKKKRFFIP